MANNTMKAKAETAPLVQIPNENGEKKHERHSADNSTCEPKGIKSCIQRLIRKRNKDTNSSDLPSTPEGPLAHNYITQTSVKLEWQSSKSDGGSPITDYIVEKSETSNDWKEYDRTKEHTLIVDNLPNQECWFRVCALNSVGKSGFLTSSQPIKAQTPQLKLYSGRKDKFAENIIETIEVQLQTRNNMFLPATTCKDNINQQKDICLILCLNSTRLDDDVTETLLEFPKTYYENIGLIVVQFCIRDNLSNASFSIKETRLREIFTLGYNADDGLYQPENKNVWEAIKYFSQGIHRGSSVDPERASK